VVVIAVAVQVDAIQVDDVVDEDDDEDEGCGVERVQLATTKI